MTGGCVVLLGPTGRNFAAGMSGGIAYVLDEDGDFAIRCNTSMVDLEPVTGDPKAALDDLRGDMRYNDAARLYRLIENHARYTNSARAREILENFDSYIGKFVKVMPTEFRRALTELSATSNDAEHVAGE
jgi:glutamate synthase (NADPH/NADH) large chain